VESWVVGTSTSGTVDIRTFVVRHLDDSKGHRRRSYQSLTLHFGVILALISDGLVSGVKGLVSFTDHGEREVGATWQVAKEVVKDWKAGAQK
jgi:hypothetical protein